MWCIREGLMGGMICMTRMRGYADPLLLIILWVLLASTGAWSYVEAKRTKAIEHNQTWMDIG